MLNYLLIFALNTGVFLQITLMGRRIWRLREVQEVDPADVILIYHIKAIVPSFCVGHRFKNGLSMWEQSGCIWPGLPRYRLRKSHTCPAILGVEAQAPGFFSQKPMEPPLLQGTGCIGQDVDRQTRTAVFQPQSAGRLSIARSSSILSLLRQPAPKPIWGKWDSNFRPGQMPPASAAVKSWPFHIIK